MQMDSLMLLDRTWIGPVVATVEMPIGLTHIDSSFCWCDPIVEEDEAGQEVVLHRGVSWN
jgi:hypothetical protein